MTTKFLILAAAGLIPAGASYAQTPAAADSSASTAATAQSGGVTLATRDDIKTGASVVDQAGAAVGTIESVTATGAVVATGAARAEIPLASFGKSDKGLVIAMTKAQLEAAAKGS